MNKVKIVKKMGTSQLMIKSLKGQQLSEHEVYSINNNEVRGLLHLDVVQKNNSFNRIIIPCVYKENFTDKYLAIQKELYIIPFVSAIEKLNVNKPVFLTLILKDNYLFDKEIREEILN